MASYASPTRLQGLLQVMQRWPRDTRDTLFMLAVIAWVLLPQVSHLPLWCSLTAAAVLLWRTALTLTGRPLPRRCASRPTNALHGRQRAQSAPRSRPA